MSLVYEKEKLELMSDLGITIAVAKKLGYSFRALPEGVFLQVKHSGECVISIEGIFKPCDRWDDVMPITDLCYMVVSRGMAQVYNGTELVIEHYHENTKRAMCEAFLMYSL